MPTAANWTASISPRPRTSRGGVSPADYLDLKPQMNGYGEIAAYGFADMNLSAPGEPAEMARGLRISANFFSTLGVQPDLGRPDEELLGNHHHRRPDRLLHARESRLENKPHGSAAGGVGRTYARASWASACWRVRPERLATAATSSAGRTGLAS